jgi:hypothetical protein
MNALRRLVPFRDLLGRYLAEEARLHGTISPCSATPSEGVLSPSPEVWGFGASLQDAVFMVYGNKAQSSAPRLGACLTDHDSVSKGCTTAPKIDLLACTFADSFFGAPPSHF